MVWLKEYLELAVSFYDTKEICFGTIDDDGDSLQWHRHRKKLGYKTLDLERRM